jgi:hypothetical protein
MQQHYLPESYLNFFEIQDRPGLVCLYQRGKATVVVSTHNVAKEKNLYSFTDKDGKLNDQLEIGLAEFEGKARPLLTKLNKAIQKPTITVDERNTLMTFVSLQAVRTPAFRTMLAQSWAKIRQTMLQAHAANKEAFTKIVHDSRNHASREPLSEREIEEVREFVLDDTRYTVQAEGEYFIGQQFQAQDSIFRAIYDKRSFLLCSPGKPFVTSDHPVQKIGRPDVHFMYRGGFLFSDVLFPIGRNKCLFLRTEKKPEDIVSTDQVFSIDIKEIGQPDVERINKMTIDHAEDYLFGSESDVGIKDLFDRTTKSTRFHISSPFTRQRNEEYNS